MALKMDITDEIRLNIIDALLKPHSVIPNMRQIKRYTHYHKATIKSSLDFLSNEGLLQGYGPKVNFRKLGYTLEAIVMLKADLSNKKVFERFLEVARKDPHLYRLSAIIGSGNWNLVTRHIYRDVESYHNESQKTYFQGIQGIYDLVKDRQIFYATEPFYKNESRTASIIELIRQEKGYGLLPSR